ncbi:hypothetical protein SAMN05444722_3708 [Rhodovulum sp. ES.010]|uniref:hypothetical protein n=1 Tax=Rhodovulum sp. ES.010 TaxID=1882821 RepID=UPI00092CA688|nr:hypothetical protein [Rhodovulum sp. ES.010]SIO57292.1 hypothetical protein SAMN05444722_3708 [Rhodovulum sp. ES.010]
MTDRRLTDEDLETLFEAGRAARPAPPDALLARVMDDAITEAGGRSAGVIGPVPRRGVLAGLVTGLGGWPALGGLATAGVVGLWIGYVAPGGIDTVRAAMLGGGYGIADMMPSLDGYLAEG